MNSTLPILLVEDDEMNVMRIKRAFGEIKILNELVVKGDGTEALGYLSDPAATLPCVILLDINMPKMNGIELLREIKANQVLRRIPVIMLTTSREAEDRFASFDLSVAGYMQKPTEYKKLVEIMKGIDQYWTQSELP